MASYFGHIWAFIWLVSKFCSSRHWRFHTSCVGGLSFHMNGIFFFALFWASIFQWHRGFVRVASADGVFIWMAYFCFTFLSFNSSGIEVSCELRRRREFPYEWHPFFCSFLSFNSSGIWLFDLSELLYELRLIPNPILLVTKLNAFKSWPFFYALYEQI